MARPKKYGNSALLAMKLITSNQAQGPGDAWETGTTSVFGKGSSSQVKSCPRDAFLGLCEAGLVRGVTSGQYTRSTKNKAYAVKAAKMIKAQPSLSGKGEIDLWRKVMHALGESPAKTYNQQMDVVLTLFQNGFIQ